MVMVLVKRERGLDLRYMTEEIYSDLKNEYEIVIKMLSSLAKSLGKKSSDS